ncbi:hypothetical protein [Ottowia thiooxydans]
MKIARYKGKSFKDGVTTIYTSDLISMPRIFWFYFSVVCLVLLLSKATRQLIRFFPSPDAPLNNDAYWTYLPNARALLDHPWEFLTEDPASYYVAPLGYIWPALWGADPALIQLANCFLFLTCILMMWRTASQLGGIWAGILATALIVFHPDLTRHIPLVLTESIYLFGLMLLTMSVVEYALNESKPRAALRWAALGLTVTLLSRPVLQIFALAALVAGLASWTALSWLRVNTSFAHAARAIFLNRPVVVAFIAALVLPAAVVLKNGLCFGLWGIGTGSGSGLYYGVSPFKMGLEPVFSGFNYDAGVTPLTVAPETKGNPLALQSERINTRVAFDIVKNTSFLDNTSFFAQKLKAWLFYSTPEMRMSRNLRGFRTFEWLAIGLAALTILISSKRRALNRRLRLPGRPGMERQKIVVLGLLLLGVLGMSLQLTPVLYNTRYNTFFLEPWMILLASVGTAIVLQLPEKFRHLPVARRLVWLAGKALIVLMLAGMPSVLHRYSLHHESWGMDPYRPGPVAVLLDRSSMGPIHAASASSLGSDRWRLESAPATLTLPLQVVIADTLAPIQVMDGIWRLRFAVSSPEDGAINACRKATLALTNAHPKQTRYEPLPTLYLKPDSAMHTYAIDGNGEMRPAGSGALSITFHCPPGTIVTWAGAELLKSTLPEAAHALIHQNRAIDPYLRRDPR